MLATCQRRSKCIALNLPILLAIQVPPNKKPLLVAGSFMFSAVSILIGFFTPAAVVTICVDMPLQRRGWQQEFRIEFWVWRAVPFHA
jgi:hypothetical protein